MLRITNTVGGGLMLASFASTILYFFDYNVKLLLWVDMFGPTVGFLIRAVMFLVGAAVLAAGFLFESQMQAPQEQS